MNLIYTPLVGIPLCTLLVTVGLLLCLTVIAFPLGLTVIALGFKTLTLGRRPA